MRTFKLYRKIDDSGVSGTGHVAEGVQFTDGRCVITWLGDVHSVNIYNSPEEIIKIHGHSGHTLIEWDVPCSTCGDPRCDETCTYNGAS